jgi:hypothetical protein
VNAAVFVPSFLVKSEPVPQAEVLLRFHSIWLL